MVMKFNWLRVASRGLPTVRPSTRLPEKSGVLTPPDRQPAVTVLTVNEDDRGSPCVKLTDQILDRRPGAIAGHDLVIEHNGCSRRQGAAFLDNGSPPSEIQADRQTVGKHVPPEPIVADVEP